MPYWSSCWDYEGDEEFEADYLSARRQELREEMCGHHEPSDLLSLAIYEAVREDASATSDDVLDMYLLLAMDGDDEREQDIPREDGDRRQRDTDSNVVRPGAPAAVMLQAGRL